MAQISFTKLGLKPNTEIINISFNEQVIEVKQYLPIDQKLEALTNILNMSADDIGYYNPAKLSLFLILELVYRYTNIKFTDKQKEDPKKLYDQLVGSGLFNEIKKVIPEDEINWFFSFVNSSMDQIYKYRDSVYGILDALKTDYSDLELDINKLRERLADTTDLSTLKEVLDKLG